MVKSAESKTGPSAPPSRVPSPSTYPRVIYERNQLVEVTCQLRYPPILMISAKPPAGFQEMIRAEFPGFRDLPNGNMGVPKGVPPEVAALMQANVPSSGRVYEFFSSDPEWKVTLANNALALTTTRYPKWEAFRQKLSGPLAALISEYKPTYFSRVGLRYVDAIRKSRVELQDVAWSELVAPHLACTLGTEMANAVLQTTAESIIRLDDGNGMVRIVAGLAEFDDAGTKEPCFLLDSDFFTDKRTATKDIDDTLNYFNLQARNFFRWSIRERLHNAMGPHSLEG